MGDTRKQITFDLDTNALKNIILLKAGIMLMK